MLPRTLFVIFLHFLRVLSDVLALLPCLIIYDPAIDYLFSQIYSIAGQVAPTDPATLN